MGGYGKGDWSGGDWGGGKGDWGGGKGDWSGGKGGGASTTKAAPKEQKDVVIKDPSSVKEALSASLKRNGLTATTPRSKQLSDISQEVLDSLEIVPAVEDEVMAFMFDHSDVDMECQEKFKSLHPKLQKLVINKGSMLGVPDLTKAFMSRILMVEWSVKKMRPGQSGVSGVLRYSGMFRRCGQETGCVQIVVHSGGPPNQNAKSA